MEATTRVWVLVLAAALPLMLLLEGARSWDRFSTDGDALTSLRNSVSDPEGALISWDPQVSFCTWFRVKCNDTERIERLELGHHGLSGQIVPELGYLDQLQYLNLYTNNFNGSIPTELGNLTKLISMDLFENSFSGSIPSSFGSNLQSLLFLRLQENQLSGPIPSELASIPNLRILNVSTNNLCGNVPPELSRIEYLDVSNNPGLGSPCP